MNTVNIIGNIVSKPQLMKAGELPYTKFSIAVNRYNSYNGEKHVEFFNVVAFGKNAETICQHLDKGYSIPISGHLHQNVYTKDNKKVSSVCIYLDSFTFVTNKSASKECKHNDVFTPFN